MLCCAPCGELQASTPRACTCHFVPQGGSPLPPANLLGVLDGLEVDQLALAVGADVVVEGQVAPALGRHGQVGGAVGHQLARLLKALHRRGGRHGAAALTHSAERAWPALGAAPLHCTGTGLRQPCAAAEMNTLALLAHLHGGSDIQVALILVAPRRQRLCQRLGLAGGPAGQHRALNPSKCGVATSSRTLLEGRTGREKMAEHGRREAGG